MTPENCEFTGLSGWVSLRWGELGCIAYSRAQAEELVGQFSARIQNSHSFIRKLPCPSQGGHVQGPEDLSFAGSRTYLGSFKLL